MILSIKMLLRDNMCFFYLQYTQNTLSHVLLKVEEEKNR